MHIAHGSVVAIEAVGSKGQFLYVSQPQELVVVRLIDVNRWQSKADSFDDFETAVAALSR